MSALKFLTLVNGIKTLVSAITSSAGAGDANKIIATDSNGKIDASFLTGVDDQTEEYVTSEDLTDGMYVNIFENTGTDTARRADATLGLPAHGFVLASTTTGQNAVVYTIGKNTSETGKIAGSIQFLGLAGASSSTPVAETTGYINQVLGNALSDTIVRFEYNNYIDIA